MLQTYRYLHHLLVEYKDARRGPTVVFLQSPLTPQLMAQQLPALDDFPNVHIPALERCVSVCACVCQSKAHCSDIS